MMVWRIDAPGQTIALTTEGAVPRVIWWGPTLPADEDLAGLARAQVSDLTGGMLDRLPDLTLCPLPALLRERKSVRTTTATMSSSTVMPMASWPARWCVKFNSSRILMMMAELEIMSVPARNKV